MKYNLNLKQSSSPLTYDQITDSYSSHIIHKLIHIRDYIPYFMTLSFSGALMSQNNMIFTSSRMPLNTITKVAFYEHDRIYRHIVSNMMSHFTRKKYLYPLTFDFFDLPNSQNLRSINLDSIELPHIHSIYLVHKQTRSEFKSLANDNFDGIVQHRQISKTTYSTTSLNKSTELTFPSLISIHAKEIEDITDIPNVVTYASKLLKHNRVLSMQNDCIFFSQNPKSESEK